MSCLALLSGTSAIKAGNFHIDKELALHVKYGFFWGTLLRWLLVFEEYVGNNSPFPHAPTHTYMMLMRSACHISIAESGGSQVEDILESRGYWLWLGTVCALHSKWPPLPYHLWIINVQSVGLSFVIGHFDTVQFSSRAHVSLTELGSSLNAPSLHSLATLCFINHTQGPRSTSVWRFLARGKMLSWRNCLASSHYSNISQTQGPWMALEINICMAFKSQYIPAVSWVAFKVQYHPAVK